MASLLALVSLAPCGHGASSAAPLAALREQVIPLRAGWNAVFVEVEPVESEPARVLAGLPVEILAGFFRQTHAA